MIPTNEAAGWTHSLMGTYGLDKLRVYWLNAVRDFRRRSTGQPSPRGREPTSAN